MNTMQASPTAAPRRSTMDEYIRLNTTQTPSVRWERDAIAAAAGEILPVPVSTVFARFPFSAKGM
jgi:hypothetical protein